MPAELPQKAKHPGSGVRKLLGAVLKPGIVGGSIRSFVSLSRVHPVLIPVFDGTAAI